MLGRRGLDTKTERVVTEALEKVNMYTIGKQLIVFSQKDKGLVERDVNKILEFADGNDFTNGVILVALVKPSENVLKVIKSMTKDRMIQFFYIDQLLIDATKHQIYSMPHRILKDDERTEIMKKYNINEPENQIPWIDSQDPQVKWIGARPGDIIEVTRHSPVSGSSLYYRYCVPDVNVA